MKGSGAIFRAIATGLVTGLGVTMLGVSTYSVIARANLRVSPSVPWGAALGLVLLLLYWRYLGGSGWPRRTSAYRARMRRARPISRSVLLTTLGASGTGIVFVVAAMTFALRLTTLPADALRLLPPDAGVPWWTVAPLLFMLALVAGVCEEIGIRGYLQKAVEESAGPVLAIVLSALTFTLLHTNKAWFIQQALPMFTAAVWYGYLTFATQSIYPMIGVHTLIDLGLFARYEIMHAPIPASIASVGLTAEFWLNLAVAVIFGLVAFALTARVARTRDGAREV